MSVAKGVIMIRRIFSLAVFLLGLIFSGGGIKLAALGGSTYYCVVGIMLVVNGVLLWRKSRWAVPLYSVLLLVTVAWAIGEAGLTFWALVPRLGFFVALGALFFLPGIRNNAVGNARFGSGWFVAGLVAALVVGSGIRSLTDQGSDPLYQTGTISSDTIASKPLTDRLGLEGDDRDWLRYGSNAGNNRFSSLDQITPDNVGQLEKVWEYHVGPGAKGHGLEVTPLKIGDSVFICTPYSDVIALDAETGKEKWYFHAQVDDSVTSHGVCRGMAYYKVPEAAGLCAERIIHNTVDGRLVALDTATGQLCTSFGDNGTTSLLKGMGDHAKGYYLPTSAPTLVHGKVVIGGNVLDNQFWGEPPGVIRAYDAVTGKFAWAFDMGRPDEHGEPAEGQSYTLSTPNSWAPMGADEELGLVFVPTGNSTPDWYGAQRRPFDDQYSSSVLALDADTGSLRWSFQTTHHDLWDYDVASPPTVVDLPGPAGSVRALIQPTKRGEMYVLDPASGKPILPVVEKAVSQIGHAPGERLSPTQPFSDEMPSFRGAELRESEMWGITPLDQLWCRIKFKGARYEGTMTPPGLTPSIVWPGALGGSNWGGISIDRDRHLMIVNSNRVPMYVRLIARDMLPESVKPTAVNEGEGGVHPMEGTPYGLEFLPFLSPVGIPCIAPPYSRLTAVDLESRKVVWSKPIGTARDLKVLGIPAMLPIEMGIPTIGSSLATRSGLVFIGAVPEKTFRAFNSVTGQEVWSSRLSSAAISGPMTYWSEESERQFVVVAAGGNVVVGAEPGDSIVAYALPKKR
jgi:quinoprotein glucose dehydrogenase